MATARMAMRGHSRCSIELLDSGVVRKSAGDAATSRRLKVQIAKQRAFLETMKLAGIRAPAILAEAASDAAHYHADMEFSAAADFISYFSDAGVDAIDKFAARLLSFIRACERKSPLERVGAKALQGKFWEVTAALRSRAAEMPSPDLSSPSPEGTPSPAFLLRCEAYFAAACPPSLVLPVGLCHGDLTFSNILISPHTHDIVLLDFLDPFIESPVQDLVKLRQDTCYRWSFQLYPHAFDGPRMAMVMDYLDRGFSAAFAERPYYRSYYRLFQFLNFYRILPYATDPDVAQFVINVVDGLTAAPPAGAGGRARTILA